MARKGIFTVLAVLGSLLLVCSCICAEEGVTDTEIHIGQWGPQTGPAAPWGRLLAARATISRCSTIRAEFTAEKSCITCSTTLTIPQRPRRASRNCRRAPEYSSGRPASAPPQGLAVIDYLMDRKIPWVGPAAGSLHWIDPPRKYLFATYPLYVIEAKALVTYAVEKLRKKRFAIVYQNDDYGKNGVKGGQGEAGRIRHGFGRRNTCGNQGHGHEAARDEASPGRARRGPFVDGPPATRSES